MKWWQHVPNSELYDNLPEVGDKVAARRMGLVGHCSRHPDLPAGKVIYCGNQRMGIEEERDNEKPSWTP